LQKVTSASFEEKKRQLLQNLKIFSNSGKMFSPEAWGMYNKTFYSRGHVAMSWSNISVQG